MNKYEKIITRTLIIIGFLLLTATESPAVNIRSWRWSARGAKIRAVARVTSVEKTGERRNGEIFLTVTFKLITPLASDPIPPVFTGRCTSLAPGKSFPGGPYHYPEAGTMVCVTISDNGGTIARLTEVSEAEAKKEVEEFKKGEKIFGQVKIIKTPDRWTEVVRKDFYIYKVGGKKRGYLKIFYDLHWYNYDLIVNTGDGERKITIVTECFGSPHYRLSKNTVSISAEEKSVLSARFEDPPDEKIPEGIPKPSRPGGEIVTRLPKHTVTDFIVFELVTFLPFQEGTVLKFNSLDPETLELRKDVSLTYGGKEDGLHLFTQTHKGKVIARYFLDDEHVLIKAVFSDGSEFIACTREETLSVGKVRPSPSS